MLYATFTKAHKDLPYTVYTVHLCGLPECEYHFSAAGAADEVCEGQGALNGCLD